MNTTELLYEILRRRKEGMGKTRLLKIAYLTEVFYKRLSGERLTNGDWVYWQYGPYLPDYNRILDSGAFVVESGSTAEIVSAPGSFEGPHLNTDMEISINRALKFADEDLYRLLDFVYFDTEPMMQAGDRGEALDFNAVKPEKFYQVKEYRVDAKTKANIGKKLSDWKAKRNDQLR